MKTFKSHKLITRTKIIESKW